MQPEKLISHPLYFKCKDVTGGRLMMISIMLLMMMMLTMLFAAVCEVVEIFESKCALVPPIITNLGENH